MITLFKLRVRLRKLKSTVRKLYYGIHGLSIGKNTILPRCHISWPHNIKIGDNCILEHDIYFKHDGPYFAERTICIGNNVFIGANVEFNIRKGITVGENCLIASGCRFIDHDHGFGSREQLLKAQAGVEQEIVIGADVWIGANVVVLKGVRIGDGSIIGAGAVVTHNVSPYEIWAGVPAKRLSERP